MGCFNTLFILLLGGIYLFWPDLMQVEGFWFSFIAIWLCFFVSWALFGDIADEISGVNNYNDENEFLVKIILENLLKSLTIFFD